MLFDQFFIGYLALAVTLVGIGFKLVNPRPQIWAPVAFTLAALFATLAAARYAQLWMSAVHGTHCPFAALRRFRLFSDGLLPR
jgi:hypothetical protein